MRNKKNIIAVIFLFLILALGGVSVFVAYRINTQEKVAPTAPESKPSASEPAWVGSDACKMTFTVLPTACTPRPACLDATPACNVVEPAGGWCSAVTCPSGKTMYKDVAENTPGSYNTSAANRIAEGSTVNPGQKIVYVIEYAPSADVSQAVIEDVLSSNLEFVDASSLCAKQTGTNKIVCTIDQENINAGKVAIRVKIKDTATLGLLQNSATISSVFGTTDTASSKATCNSSLTVSAVPTVAIACRSNTAMNSSGTGIINTVGENETFIYSLEITNTGAAAASNIVITDSLASGKLVFVDSGSGCTFNETTKLVTCNTSLNAGETKKITFRVKTTADLTDKEVISNTASAKLSSVAESTGSECARSLTVALPVIAAVKEAYKDNINNVAGTYVLTDAITTVSKNQTFVYAIKVTNSGTGTASGVIISDNLSGQNQNLLTLVDLDTRCDWNSDTKLVKCTLNMAPNSTETPAFRVKVDDSAVNGAIIQNVGTVVHQETTVNVNKNLTVSTIVGCDHTCTTTAECQTGSGLSCDPAAGKCRKTECSSETSCSCPVTITPTATPTLTVAPTNTITVTAAPTNAPTAAPTNSPETMPEAGIFDIPGAAMFGGGLLLAIVGILLAL